MVVGTNHAVGFRWNYADNFGAVSKGATLTDWYLDGLCDSFRRAGLPLHEVTLAALIAETLGMRIIPSHCVCGHTDKTYFTSQIGIARFDASSSCLRKAPATHCWSSLSELSPARSESLLTRCMSRRLPWDSLKCELRAHAGLLSLSDGIGPTVGVPNGCSSRVMVWFWIVLAFAVRPVVSVPGSTLSDYWGLPTRQRKMSFLTRNLRRSQIFPSFVLRCSLQTLGVDYGRLVRDEHISLLDARSALRTVQCACERHRNVHILACSTISLWFSC